MERIVRLSSLLRTTENKQAVQKENRDRAKIISDIQSAGLRLKQIRQTFDLVSDPDLVEAAIYEERAMEARYRHLLRQARENGITFDPYKAGGLL